MKTFSSSLKPHASSLFCGGTRAGTGRRLLTALTQVRFVGSIPTLRNLNHYGSHPAG
jgi:hypothetical protein